MKERLAVIGREHEVNDLTAALLHRFTNSDSALSAPRSALCDAIITQGIVVLHSPPGTGATTLIEHLSERLSIEGRPDLPRLQVITLIAPSVAHDTRSLLMESIIPSFSVARREPGRVNEDLTPEAPSAIAEDFHAVLANQPTVMLVDRIENYPRPITESLCEMIRRCGEQLACIITTHQPDFTSRLPATAPDGASKIPVVPLRPLANEELWQIVQSVIATQVDPRSDATAEQALRARISAPGVTAQIARLMGEAHLLGTSCDSHLLLSERIDKLSTSAIALGTGLALWDTVLPIAQSANEEGADEHGRGQRFQMARAATGLPHRVASKAQRELHNSLILDSESRYHDPLWADAFLGLSQEHLLERYRISLADAVAGRTVGTVTDSVIIAELLSEVRAPPVRFSPWLKTAARSLLTVRADTSQRFLHALLRCPELSDLEVGVASAMLVQTRVALGFNDLRSQVSVSMMEEFITDAPATTVFATNQTENPTRYDAFAMVMTGRLDAARAIYNTLSLQQPGSSQQGASQVAPDLLLEHASICALAGDLNVCRNLATEVWTQPTSPALRVGSGAMIVLADTMTGRWDQACQLSHEVITVLGEDREAHTARYQPWLFGALAQIHSNHPDLARTWLHEGRTHCDESGLAWAVPAHDALLSYLELQTGHLDRARKLARAAVDAGPEADGLGAANWAFATLLHLDYLNLVDPTATLVELAAWEAPVQVLGRDHILRVRALIELSQGRVESAYLRMERLWHLSCDRELWVVISGIAVLTAHLAHLCGQPSMVAAIALRLEALWQRSGRSNVMVWCSLEIVRGLSEADPRRAERAAELMDLEEFSISSAEAWNVVSQLWAHLAQTDHSRAAATRSAQILHRVGAQGLARQVMTQNL